MKKKIAAGILALAMVAGMSTSAFAANSYYVYEHEKKGESLNDTFADAQTFHLTDNVIINGSILKGDQDFYRFAAPETGDFQFDFGAVNRILPAGEAVVTLYDEDKNKIRSKKVNSRNELKFTEKVVKGNKYYLKVESTHSKSYEYLIYIDKQN
ncbi:hypothetical protein BBG47_00320 [Paenibacillus sp. KS1]|uniref:hypothetical protein n=1 Tax=Paenibacillus sp. KS1 TaxID=1849249 RepID=UPI00080645FC|nr:hypothetical protein [Paenibacillus sp. KS1]OBY81560.1 hypothetical protein BBG47_00320 [Paenibacillus sp. KS1]